MNASFLNNGKDGKNADLKKRIIGLCIIDGDHTIPDFGKKLDASIPTINKLVGELKDEGFLDDFGKYGKVGGRRPSVFGLNPAMGYIVGVAVENDFVSIAVTNFRGTIVDHEENLHFELVSTEKSFIELSALVKKEISKMGIQMKDVLVCGINLSGRVNYQTGFSFSYFLGEEKPITDFMQAELGVPVMIENDSRAMAYAEYLSGDCGNARNVIFINASWGLGMGMILDGNLFYGKSGYSGEFGHFPMLSNNQICRCGKVGCLETGASGLALHRIVLEKLQAGQNSSLMEIYKKKSDITLNDILTAIREEDILAIESIEEVGFTLGKAIAGLVKIFNPEMVVIGGRLASAEDSLLLPLKSEMNKYSLNIISKDTVVRLSKLGDTAGPLGACLLSRSKILGFM